MRTYKLENFSGGWILGAFKESIVRDNTGFEIAIKEYKSGQKEKSHVHKIATEWTVIISGIVSMNGRLFYKGDIVQINPGESCEFICIEDAVNIVVKIPSVLGDKYVID